MLRLDKTVTRKVLLHYNEEPENRARWQAMSFAEKREVVLVLQQRRQELRALSGQWREQDPNKKATLSRRRKS